MINFHLLICSIKPQSPPHDTLNNKYMYIPNGEKVVDNSSCHFCDFNTTITSGVNVKTLIDISVTQSINVLYDY